MSTAEESISNISGTTFEGEAPVQESYSYLWSEIAFVIFAFIGILANIAIIHTIYRYKRLQSTKHIFIANWAIVNLCFLLLAPSGYRIISTIMWVDLPEAMMCMLYEAGSTFHLTEILFVICISLDWFLGEFFEKIAEKYRPHQIKILKGLWLITFIFIFVTCLSCVIDMVSLYYKMFYVGISVLGTMTLVLLFQIIRFIQKLRKRPIKNCFMLNLVTGFACSYLLCFLIVIITEYSSFYHPFIGTIAACLMFSSSVVNLTILYCFNKRFQSCFQQTLKRTPNYDEEFTDADNFDDIRISFNNQKEELLTNAY